MNGYVTKDTGEAITLLRCGVIEIDDRCIVVRGDHQEWTFTFEPTELQQRISAAYFEATTLTRGDIADKLKELVEDQEPLTYEIAAMLFNGFIRERKSCFKDASKLPKKYG